MRETQNFQSEQNIAEALRLARGVRQHRRLTVRRRRLTGRGYTPGAIRSLSFLKPLSAIGAKRLLASRRPGARVGSDPEGLRSPAAFRATAHKRISATIGQTGRKVRKARTRPLAATRNAKKR